MHVASVCFTCFKGMLQVFHSDVTKVDRNVAYVAMVVHVCCKLLFLIFHLFFQTYVANVFIWVLHMFHTYVASVLSGRCVCFTIVFQVFSGVLQVFQMHVSSISSVFRFMLHLYISKVDRVLHLPPRFLPLRLSVSSSSRHRLGIRCPLPLFFDAGDIWGSAGNRLQARASRRPVRPDVCALQTSKPEKNRGKRIYPASLGDPHHPSYEQKV
jgi:hypothetical protein